MALYEFVTKRDIITCSPDSTIEDVSVLMTEHGVGCVVMVEDDKPVGIVTDRDLVVRGLYNGFDYVTTPISDIMSRPVEMVFYDASVYDVIELMKEKRVRRICVVDGSGKAVSILSASDVFELLTHEMGELSDATGPHFSKLLRQETRFSDTWR